MSAARDVLRCFAANPYATSRMQHTFRALIELVLQHLVPEHLRGRVMAPFTMSFLGVLPVSALVAGGLAPVAGIQLVFVVAGFGAIVAGLAFRRQLSRLREVPRPVMAENGLRSSIRGRAPT